MALLTVDLLIEGPEGVLLIRRKNQPFKGYWALPGGFVEDGETCEQAAVREAKEETGLNIELLSINTVLSSPNRDPRGRTVSIVYDAKPIEGGSGDQSAPAPSTDASEAKWFKKVPEKEKIAFDHMEVLKWYSKAC